MPEFCSLDDLDATPHARPFPGEEPTVVRLSLAAGERVPPHRHPDRQVVCHVLTGEVELDLGEEAYDLSAGDLARFDGDQDISPRALEDSEALLVLAHRVE